MLVSCDACGMLFDQPRVSWNGQPTPDRRTRCESCRTQTTASTHVTTRPPADVPTLAYLNETPSSDLVHRIIENDRQQRQLAYFMTRELSRLSNAVDRQQAVLEGLANRLSPDRASGSPDTARLQALEDELARERETIERLRRSKLTLEQRAVRAETQLEDRNHSGGLAKLFRSRSD